MQPVVLSRPWPEDVDAITAALADWDTVRWLTTVPWPYRITDAQAFVARASLDEHAIRVDDRLAGVVQAGRAFGLWIAPERQGQGIGRRASVLALSRLFRTGATDVRTRCLIGNERSRRLLNWLGFQPIEEVQLFSASQGRSVAAMSLRLSCTDFASRHGFTLRTPRLHIDPVVPADLPDLRRIASLPQITDLDAPFLWESSGCGLLPPLSLAVRLKGRVIGAVCLDGGEAVRLSLVLDPALWGQGLGQEMAAAVLAEMTARLGPTEMVAQVALDNLAARKIMKNLGFRRAEDVALPEMGADAPAKAALYRWRPGLLS
ncbi:GNAT family N-acetyltransferase [Paracoccus sp. (in: a-proteobacteria)]|uniref:GNAT family N-acetyltransferase n=1 Tax=Paracoccus sp. TaxID=267 RepID=UPI00396CE083